MRFGSLFSFNSNCIPPLSTHYHSPSSIIPSTPHMNNNSSNSESQFIHFWDGSTSQHKTRIWVPIHLVFLISSCFCCCLYLIVGVVIIFLFSFEHSILLLLIFCCCYFRIWLLIENEHSERDEAEGNGRSYELFSMLYLLFIFSFTFISSFMCHVWLLMRYF